MVNLKDPSSTQPKSYNFHFDQFFFISALIVWKQMKLPSFQKQNLRLDIKIYQRVQYQPIEKIQFLLFLRDGVMLFLSFTVSTIIKRLMQSAENNQNRKVFRDKTKNITYYKGKLLGTGGFAKCYQAVQSDKNVLYAAKVIPKKQINQKRQRYKLLVQIKIHKSLKHRHIVQFIDAFEDKQNIYILLEYCRNYTLKDLAKRRKRLTQFQTRIYISQIVKAMIYIHSQGIIHRDLKLGNVLINDQMDTKICDFGLSTKIKNEGDTKKTICGTPNYIAPEILEEQGHSYQVDIWSIGVIMYALLFGKPPFEDNTVQQTYENIKNNRYIFPPNIQVSLDAKDLINRILVMDATKRLSLNEILEHKFMQFPEGVPRNLPVSSLAVPPIDYDKRPTRINLDDMHLQLSEQIEGDNSELEEQRVLPQNQSKQKKISSLFIFIRECFKYEDTFGYLLSNGVVGIFNKQKDLNFIFQFGAQYYYIIRADSKPIKAQIPSNVQDNEDLQRLFHFKAFFIQKYSLFKLDQMRKRSSQGQNLIYLKKAIAINDLQIVTRMSNNIIQLHFKDLTSLAINREDQRGIYLVTKRGKIVEINYNQCKQAKLKTKIRRFSNLIQKLSSKYQQDEQEPEESYSQEEGSIQN